jgi:hypothetical protein
MLRNAVTLALLSSVLFAAGAEAGAAPGAEIPARLKAAEKDLLIEIGEGGDKGIYVEDGTPAFATLTKAKWLQTNPDMKQDNKVLTRLSPEGRAKVDSFRKRDPNAVNTRPTADLSEVEIEQYDISKIETARRAVRAIYPFEKLTAVGASFFVPAPEDFPADKDFAATKQGTTGGWNRKQKDTFEATPEAERVPGSKPASIKAINDTKAGVRGVRFVRMT